MTSASERLSLRRFRFATRVAFGLPAEDILTEAEQIDFWNTVWVRFWKKVERRGPEECWPWKGAYNRSSAKLEGQWQRGDRPRFNLISIMPGGVKMTLAVYAYRLALWGRDKSVNLRTTEFEACHQCNNRRCCNPEHLYWGTAEQNRIDRYGLTSESAPMHHEEEGVRA